MRLLLTLSSVALLNSALGPFDALRAAPPPESDYVADLRFALEALEEKCGHFFAQKKIDWKKVSKTFLAEARKVSSDQEHLVLLVRLLARLEDGHAQVRPLDKGRSVRWPDDGWSRRTGPGMFWCQSGKKVFVKNSWGAAEKLGVRPGMEIVSVDRVPVRKWLAKRTEELADRISFSTDHQAFFYTTHWGLADMPGTKRKLVLRKGRKKASVTLVYGKEHFLPDGPAFPPEGLQIDKDLRYGRTAGGWGYLHVRRCPGNLPELTDQALEAIGEVPGLILDFRGNSGGGFDHDAFLGHFIPKGHTIAFAKRYRSAGENPYGGPIVVIVDATVRSAGETAAGIFKEDGRAYVIGESPTAGMSSSKTRIPLPSGLFELYVAVRSNKGRFNRGKGLEGIGLPPHEEVAFEPGDLAKRVDTLIRRAEEILADFPQKKVRYDPSDFDWVAPEAPKGRDGKKSGRRRSGR